MHNTIFNNSSDIWLVVEDNVIHIFDEKREAICFSYLLKKLKDTFFPVYHRYADGDMHPLFFYPNDTEMDELVESLIRQDPTPSTNL